MLENHSHDEKNLAKNSKTANTLDDDDSEEYFIPRPKKELETSGVFVAGYTGPIHRWEHPGYHFLKESPKGRTSPAVEKLFKIILVGDATVGKTSFVHRYVNNIFQHDYKGTVGVDFAMKVIWKSEKEMIKIQLWDIAGQERFTWMTRVYYRDAQGCIVMFDLNKKSTLYNAMKWKQDVDSKCHLPDGTLLPSVLLGNKCDLPIRDVTQEEIENAYKKGKYDGWTEISAKNGLMVDDSMNFLLDVMLYKTKGKIIEIDNGTQEHNENIYLNKTKKKKRNCCK